MLLQQFKFDFKFKYIIGLEAYSEFSYTVHTNIRQKLGNMAIECFAGYPYWTQN